MRPHIRWRLKSKNCFRTCALVRGVVSTCLHCCWTVHHGAYSLLSGALRKSGSTQVAHTYIQTLKKTTIKELIYLLRVLTGTGLRHNLTNSQTMVWKISGMPLRHVPRPKEMGWTGSESKRPCCTVDDSSRFSYPMLRPMGRIKML